MPPVQLRRSVSPASRGPRPRVFTTKPPTSTLPSNVYEPRCYTERKVVKKDKNAVSSDNWFATERDGKQAPTNAYSTTTYAELLKFIPTPASAGAVSSSLAVKRKQNVGTNAKLAGTPTAEEKSGASPAADHPVETSDGPVEATSLLLRSAAEQQDGNSKQPGVMPGVINSRQNKSWTQLQAPPAIPFQPKPLEEWLNKYDLMPPPKPARQRTNSPPPRLNANFGKKKNDLVATLPAYEDNAARSASGGTKRDPWIYKEFDYDKKEIQSANSQRKDKRQEMQSQRKTAHKMAVRNKKQILKTMGELKTVSGAISIPKPKPRVSPKK
ncbi:unnamed protein product [Amoebophrya sp. A120]|nr:unnamed protein product [Amoebophrya sp. A120]|eukprot:GSA120T00009849001.1